jgi:hypothetical protein
VSIWQLAKEAEKTYSEFKNSFFSRYSGAENALTTVPPSNLQLCDSLPHASQFGGYQSVYKIFFTGI